MTAKFNVGDKVWYVTSGTQQRYVQCPDCLGQRALTVILGDGSQVSIECSCRKKGWQGPSGEILAYDWHCGVESGPVFGMEINGENVRYRVTVYHAEGSYQTYPDDVFATKEEAETEAAKVLAAHQTDEAHRFANVKDQKGRHHTWAWNATYHRREIKRAKHDLEYHEGRLAVAKAKSKQPEPVTE